MDQRCWVGTGDAQATDNLTRVTLIASTVVAAVSLGVFLGGRHDVQVIAVGSISSGYAAAMWTARRLLAKR